MHDMSGEFMGLGPRDDVRARPWSPEDVAVVGPLLGREWYPELAPRHALLTGCDQLLFNLSQASGAVVAQGAAGELLGLCLANWGEPDPSDLRAWAEMTARVRDEASALGLRLRSEPSIETEGHTLLDQVARERGARGVGELELLYVVEDARGRGLGRRLMEAGLSWLRGRGATRFRLITDDACDWGLYEHMGMTRVGETTSRSANDPNLRIYVYEGEL